MPISSKFCLRAGAYAAGPPAFGSPPIAWTAAGGTIHIWQTAGRVAPGGFPAIYCPDASYPSALHVLKSPCVLTTFKYKRTNYTYLHGQYFHRDY